MCNCGGDIALACVTTYDMWSLHPYQYVYFNRLAGGLPRQGTRFETDYWATSYREGFAWVVNNVDVGGTKRINVASCDGDNQIRYYRRQWDQRRFVVPRNSDDAEIYLAFTRGRSGNASGEVLHTVERQGVRLLSVLRRSRSRAR